MLSGYCLKTVTVDGIFMAATIRKMLTSTSRFIFLT